MSILTTFGGWLVRRAYNSNLKSTRKFSRSNAHPEYFKSRDAEQANIDARILRENNDIVSAYSEALKAGVVGTGFAFQYKSKDSELNDDVERFFSYWSEFGNCEITGRFFREEAERFLASEAGIVGGFLIRHHWSKKLSTLYNFEILSTSTIDRSKNNFQSGLFNGIQTNSLGKIIGIYIYDDNTKTNSKLIPSKNITLYVDVWTDAHQYTNVTPLAPILNTLDKLSIYTEAEVKGAKKRADKSVIIATEAYDIMLKAQEDFIRQNAEGTEDRARAEEEYQELLTEFSATGLHNGAIPILGGENTQVWDLKQAGDTIYADINENSKQILSKALGLSASTVAGIPESSYNVALKNSQSDEIKFSIVGQKIINVAFKTIYRNVVEAGHILGFYDIPNFYTNKIKNDMLIKITRKQLGHIDVLKQVKGDKEAVESGFKSTISTITAGGKDYQDVLKDEITYELAKKEAYETAGLVYVQTGLENVYLAEKKEDAKSNNLETKKGDKQK